MAKVKENERNLSSWGIIVQEPQSDHLLRRVFFCKSSVKNGPIVNWYELNSNCSKCFKIFGKSCLPCYRIQMRNFVHKLGSDNKKYEFYLSDDA